MTQISRKKEGEEKGVADSNLDHELRKGEEGEEEGNIAFVLLKINFLNEVVEMREKRGKVKTRSPLFASSETIKKEEHIEEELTPRRGC